MKGLGLALIDKAPLMIFTHESTLSQWPINLLRNHNWAVTHCAKFLGRSHEEQRVENLAVLSLELSEVFRKDKSLQAVSIACYHLGFTDTALMACGPLQ